VKGCDGQNVLKRGDINIPKPVRVFNNQQELDFKYYRRHTLAHNLASLYEGYTISQANGPDHLGPFIPFSYDSSGGISSMFFLADFESDCGDVIIDCGFTKLFMELTEDGTLRYVQNIAALTIQAEKHLRRRGQNGPKNFRPKSFSFPIDNSLPFDVLYLCDATGSMSSTLSAAKDKCVAIADELGTQYPDFSFQFGAVFYRDPVDASGDQHETFQFTGNIRLFQTQIQNVAASGGGDGPEDWVGAYKLALDAMKWRRGLRLIVHLADAPAHGRMYCGTTNHEEESPKLKPLIDRCAGAGIKIVGMPIGREVLSYEICKNHYVEAKGPMYTISQFESSAITADLFQSQIIKAVICAAPKLRTP